MTIRKKLNEKMRPILAKRRAALRRMLREDWDRISNGNSFDVGDSGDGAVENEYRDLSTRLSDFESRELKKIDAAIERLDDGSYGICEECQKPIPVARLKALPFVTMCVSCQQTADRTAALGRPMITSPALARIANHVPLVRHV